jgi:hypothetical protein
MHLIWIINLGKCSVAILIFPFPGSTVWKIQISEKTIVSRILNNQIKLCYICFKVPGHHFCHVQSFNATAKSTIWTFSYQYLWFLINLLAKHESMQIIIYFFFDLLHYYFNFYQFAFILQKKKIERSKKKKSIANENK